ncbi:pyridoxamine 5'-phosphate oxidase family protein [Mollicutes bacterium LVI A0039]|nr:pyridoxamine 5'-phosphate oxidase family protein [Mollicutes bacterium LVI A0039]
MNLLEQISQCKDMVIATSLNDCVTARSVSTIVVDDKIYFQTSNKMEKYRQIAGNPRVALTKGFFQIQGNAKCIGTWSDNPKLCNKYKQLHSKSYEAYGELDEEVVIEVSIKEIKSWQYRDDKVYIVTHNLVDNIIDEQLQSKM